MSRVRDRKDFQHLQFHLWRVKDNQKEEWRDEVYMMGQDEVLEVIVESLQGLLDMHQVYGKGTRKYKCNPPDDFDHVEYGRANGVKIQWLDSLVVRLSPEATDEERYRLENDVVTLQVNPVTLRRLIQNARGQLDSEWRYGHGSDAAGGIRFSPDWLGAE